MELCHRICETSRADSYRKVQSQVPEGKYVPDRNRCSQIKYFCEKLLKKNQLDKVQEAISVAYVMARKKGRRGRGGEGGMGEECKEKGRGKGRKCREFNTS